MMHSTLDDRAQLANYCSKRCDRRFRNRGSFERFLLWFDPWDQEWVQMLTRSQKIKTARKSGIYPIRTWSRRASSATLFLNDQWCPSWIGGTQGGLVEWARTRAKPSAIAAPAFSV
jgi:hypothetical protein